MNRSVAIAGMMLGLAGCQSMGGPGVSSYFDCGPRGMLKVTYLRRQGASMQVGNGTPILLRETPATSGRAFEGAGGYRLQVDGRTARWNGATREAAAECSAVAVPR